MNINKFLAKSLENFLTASLEDFMKKNHGCPKGIHDEISYRTRERFSKRMIQGVSGRISRVIPFQDILK